MKILTDDDKKRIIQMYLNGETQKDIVNSIHCRYSTITDFLRSNGYEKRKRNSVNGSEKLKASRKHHFDERFFEKIDTEEKAYWLGFLYADGNVCINHDKNGGQKGGTVELSLKHGDEDHLIKFLNAINADQDYPIETRTPKIGDKTYIAKRISLNSIDMCNDLISHGCVPNKSLILKPPKIDNELINHFIRGYFDGDGCVSFNSKTKVYAVCILGTKEILEYIILHSGIKNVSITRCGRQGKAYQIRTNSISNTIIFYRYMYINSSIFLTRKHNIFDDLYDYFVENNQQIFIDTYSDDELIKHKSYGKPVVRISKDFSEIIVYHSLSMAYETMFNKKVTSSSIGSCCRHETKTAYGYYWLFYKEYIEHKDNLYEHILSL